VADVPETTPQRRRLAEALRELRDTAQVDQTTLARQAGWSQAKVSRIENARTLPSAADIQTWARVTSASADQFAELSRLADAVSTEATAWRVLLGPGMRRVQIAVGERERLARTMRLFQPAIVPGLLQTAEYARRLLAMANPSASKEELAEAVATRIERQQILYDLDRRFEFLITEAGLRWRRGPTQVLAGQLGQVRSLASLPNVRIGIIPLAVEANAAYLHSFVLHEDLPETNEGADEEAFVIIETYTAELAIHDPRDVMTYRQIFDRLSASAVFDDEAARLLGQITDELVQGTNTDSAPRP